MAWFSKKKESRSAAEERMIPLSDPAVLEIFGLTADTDGAFVTRHDSLTLSAVFRAVSLISGSVATLPLRVWQADPKDGIRHEVRSFLDRPTGPDGMTQTEWVETIMVCLLLHGNAYLIRKQDGRGTNSLWPVDPAAVNVEWDPSYPDGRKYTVSLADGRHEVFDCRRLVHIMGPSIDGLKGMSVLEQARRSFSAGIEGERHAYRSFKTGASIAGLVTPNQDEELTPDEARQIKHDFTSAIRGADNVGGVAVVNRRLQFNPWQMTAQDLQFLESRTFSVEDVARWFGIPPHLLGLQMQSAWGTGIAEMSRGYARYTLQPWLRRIESRLTRLFPADKAVEFDLSKFLEPDLETETQRLINLLNSGVMTLNEVRQKLNLPPVDDEMGDMHRLPPGSPTLEQMKGSEKGSENDATPDSGGTTGDGEEPDDQGSRSGL